MSEKIEIPQEVQAMFDLAEGKDHLAIEFGDGVVKLKDTNVNALLAEVKWDRANDFARNLLRNTLASQP